ncbi:MAG: radical SAM protein, partial [Myxococcota bacterium]
MFQTTVKTPLDEQPLPALELIEPNAYIMLPVQFSVGCPYTCEFCDIPMIYGRVARLKSPARVLAELDQAHAAGFVGLILFVDDNLIANRKAFRKLLAEIQGWQEQRHHPFALTGEASVNIARDEELLRAMQGARFTHLFLGVESPDAAVLEEISKKQNTLEPIVDSIRSIERHGIEVILGIIFGFDGDTPKTGERMREFLHDANAPLVYFNLLAALPKTPLWDRMLREGRLLDTGEGDTRQSESLLACLTTNVRYRLDNDLVVRMLLDTVAEVYSPREVYRRNLWNAEHVYGQQLPRRPTVRNLAELGFILRFTLGALARVLVGIGLRGEPEERREFWRFVAGVLRLRRAGKLASALEVLLRVPPNTHHLITWGRT